MKFWYVVMQYDKHWTLADVIEVCLNYCKYSMDPGPSLDNKKIITIIIESG